MKKLFLSIAITFALLLSGCATVERSALCTEAERTAIVQENERLLESRAYIEAHQRGKPFRGMVHSSLSHDQMIGAYERSYNRAVDALEYRSERFNRLCTAS